MSVKTAHALDARSSVRLSTNHEPPAGSRTRPTFDSSRSNSWVLRAIRRVNVDPDVRFDAGSAAS
ncbi:Uncharacterised protein [Mycobacteroides abscessus subsp. abscessus]|nr:Uncharacterised protein [Mycobacteroides abscessus subsp. abscessus]